MIAVVAFGLVGAIIGGIIGGTVGAVAEPPIEVRSYVVQERRPSVRVTERVVVGEPLPAAVEVYPVPSHREYSFAVVNDQRVIVEPQTRRVIQIVE